MDFNAYSRDIKEIDQILSAHLASNVGSSEFDKIREEFLEGFEIGWKFTKAEAGKQNNKFYIKIQSEEVLKIIKAELKDKPNDVGKAFGIIVSSLRNNPYYIFAVPVSLQVYTAFFEIIATKKSEFKKYFYDVTVELQRNTSYISRDWNEGQRSIYMGFLAKLLKIVS